MVGPSNLELAPVGYGRRGRRVAQRERCQPLRTSRSTLIAVDKLIQNAMTVARRLVHQTSFLWALVHACALDHPALPRGDRCWLASPRNLRPQAAGCQQGARPPSIVAAIEMDRHRIVGHVQGLQHRLQQGRIVSVGRGGHRSSRHRRSVVAGTVAPAMR